MTGVLNRLRGQVRLRVECAFPERVLNLCGARDLAFWDLNGRAAPPLPAVCLGEIMPRCGGRQSVWSAS